MLVSALEVAHLQVERVELKFFCKPFPTKFLAVTWHFVAATLPGPSWFSSGLYSSFTTSGSPRRTRRSGCRGE